MLAINEEFESFQGEGFHTGIRMYFVRTQGCDVGCYFCDTKYTWRGGLQETDEYDIIRRASKTRAEWICITGGEPLEQNISDLVHLAHDNKYKVQIETSGMYYNPIVEKIDWVCLSPKELFAKKGMKMALGILNYTDEVKCVITSKDDITYYLDQYRDFKGVKTFQPVDNKPELAEMVLNMSSKLAGEWKVMCQQHKLLKLR